MTSRVVVSIDTDEVNEIPRLGQRKVVRVNGRKPEVMWVAAVDMTAKKHDIGKVSYSGLVTYADTLWA